MFEMQVLCSLAFLVFLSGYRAEEEIDGFFKLIVEHNLYGNDKDVYMRRGIININSLKSGKGDMQSDIPLTNADLDKLKELAAVDGFYHVRVAKMMPNDPTPTYVYSFVKACALLESGLTDKITIFLDSYGSLLGATLSTDLPYCSSRTQKSLPGVNSFDTTVEISQPAAGPAPETDYYVRKLEQEKQQAKGQQVDNRSFFAKYWMYIIPFFIFMMVLNQADPGTGSGGR